jgi:Fe2+ transport system protein FeoA
MNERGRPSLPNIAIKFEHDGKRYNATFSRHDDGRVAEIYLDGGAVSNTAARLVSLLLAQGVDIKTIRRAVIGGPMAVVLDRLIEIEDGRNTAEPKPKKDGR